MNDVSIIVDMPGMPDTSLCVNPDCSTFMFLKGPRCPQCDEISMYKVVDMNYKVKRQ